MNRRDTIDLVNMTISAASLGVGILALCLNEKGDRMADKIDSSKYSSRRDLKKAYAKEIKRMAVTDVGYTGTVIVLNGKGEKTTYGLVPLDEKRKPGRPVQKAKAPGKEGSWVAMEINSKTGRDRQAIVCSSKEDARSRALSMKNAHRKGSQQSKECIQGYAWMDTSKGIDVIGWFSGEKGRVTRV